MGLDFIKSLKKHIPKQNKYNLIKKYLRKHRNVQFSNRIICRPILIKKTQNRNKKD